MAAEPCKSSSPSQKGQDCCVMDPPVHSPDSGDSSHFTIVTKDGEIQAEGSVLANSSDYFRAILRSGMRESLESRVHLLDLTSAQVTPLLEMARGCHRWPVPSAEDDATVAYVTSVAIGASYLVMPDAVQSCCDHLIASHSAPQLFAILDTILTYGWTPLKLFIEDFLAANLHRIKDDICVPYNSLNLDFVLSLLNRNDLALTDDDTAFTFATEWIHSSEPSSEEIHRVLSCIRPGLLTPPVSTQFFSLADEHGMHLWCGIPMDRLRTLPHSCARLCVDDVIRPAFEPRVNDSCLLVFRETATHKRPHAVEVTLVNLASGDVLVNRLSLPEGTLHLDNLIICESDGYVVLLNILDTTYGYLSKRMTGTLWDVARMTATDLPPLRMAQYLASCVAVVIGRRLYLLGGKVSDPHTLRTTSSDLIRVLDLSTRTWSVSDNQLPHPLYGMAAAASHSDTGWLYIAGGMSETEELSQFYRIQLESGAVEHLPPLPAPMTSHALLLTDPGGRLYAVKGRGKLHCAYYFENGRWHDASEEEVVQQMASFRGALAALGDTIYLFGRHGSGLRGPNEGVGLWRCRPMEGKFERVLSGTCMDNCVTHRMVTTRVNWNAWRVASSRKEEQLSEGGQHNHVTHEENPWDSD